MKKTMKELPGKKHPKYKEIDLCGKWEDTRTAEATIADIKNHWNGLRKGKRVEIISWKG